MPAVIFFIRAPVDGSKDRSGPCFTQRACMSRSVQMNDIESIGRLHQFGKLSCFQLSGEARRHRADAAMIGQRAEAGSEREVDGAVLAGKDDGLVTDPVG